MGRPRKIDLSLYDVIRNKDRRATVIEITPSEIICKEDTYQYMTNEQKMKKICISRNAYADGSSGWHRVNLPRVTVSYIGGKNDKAREGKTEAKECGKGCEKKTPDR